MTTEMTESKEIVDILPLYDLLQRKPEEQIRHIQAYRQIFKNKEITDFWGKRENYMYTLMNKLGMKPERKKRQSGTRKPNAKKMSAPKVKTESVLPMAKSVDAITTQKQPTIISEGFGFNINGTYSAEKLIKRLEKLSMILGDEDSEFEIKLSIKETIQ